MKRLNQVLLLGMSLGLANIVMAESFKEHSEWMVTSAYPSDTQLSTTATVLPEHFQRYSEGAEIIPSRGPSQCAVSSSRGANPFPNRFNDSSSNVC